MSVINKMLQDLDRRGAAPPQADIPRETIWFKPNPATTSWTGKAGWLLLVPAVVAGAWFAYDRYDPRTKAPAVISQVSTPPLVQQQPTPVEPRTAPLVVAAAGTPTPEAVPPVTSAPVIGTPSTSAPLTSASVITPATSVPANSAPPSSNVAALKPEVRPPEKPALEKPTPIALADPAKPAPRPEVRPNEKPALEKPTPIALADPAKPAPKPAAAAEKREAEATLKPVPERAVAEVRKATEVPAAAPRPLQVTVRAPDARPAAAPELTEGTISIERQDKPLSRAEQVAGAYRNASELMNQGRPDQAIQGFAATLRLDPGHVASRQALVSLFMERGRLQEAQTALREGIEIVPGNSAWAMLLARVQVETGDPAGALDTLEKVQLSTKNRADYQAFVGTVLQMLSRHSDAITHYEIAVQMAPVSGRWLAGLGISLNEVKRYPEAREAFRRALATNTLGEELQTFVERKLNQLP